MKEWYIKIKDKEFGPYSIIDLKRDCRVFPDTLVKKREWAIWVPIKDVPELQDLFEETEQKNEEEKKAKGDISDFELTMTAQYDPKNFYLFLLLVILILLYIAYRLWG